MKSISIYLLNFQHCSLLLSIATILSWEKIWVKGQSINYQAIKGSSQLNKNKRCPLAEINQMKNEKDSKLEKSEGNSFLEWESMHKTWVSHMNPKNRYSSSENRRNSSAFSINKRTFMNTNDSKSDQKSENRLKAEPKL